MLKRPREESETSPPREGGSRPPLLRLCSWNINGVRSKFDKTTWFRNWLPKSGADLFLAQELRISNPAKGPPAADTVKGLFKLLSPPYLGAARVRAARW